MPKDVPPHPAPTDRTVDRSMARHRSMARLAVVCVALGCGAGGPAGADTSKLGEAGSDANSEVRRYCTNVAVAAGDARFAWQTQKLAEIEGRIKAHVQDLEARTSELRGWMAKREMVEKQANERLVGIYAKMRPETAATQIAGLDDDMAAAVLSQLNPGKASAIFNELVPERATKLAALIAAAPPVAPADAAPSSAPPVAPADAAPSSAPSPAPTAGKAP